MFFGGIGEVAFPYALIKPWTILGPMVGNIVSLFILQIFNGGTVAAVSPGSFLALLAMTPKGSFIVNIIAYIAATVVSFAIVAFFLIRDKSVEAGMNIEETAGGSGIAVNNLSKIDAPKTLIKKIAFACDAGMGSSVMGVSMLKTVMQKEMIQLELVHTPINEIPADADVIITNVTLEQRAKEMVMKKYNKAVPILTIENFLDKKRYQEIAAYLKENS
jgi:PTS system mannitol-specific IIC component